MLDSFMNLTDNLRSRNFRFEKYTRYTNAIMKLYRNEKVEFENFQVHEN